VPKELLELKRRNQAESLSRLADNKVKARVHRFATFLTWFEGYTGAFNPGVRANSVTKPALENHKVTKPSNRPRPKGKVKVRIRSRLTRTAKPKFVTVVLARSLPCDAAEEDAVGAAGVANLRRARQAWPRRVTKTWFPPSNPKKGLSGPRRLKRQRKSSR
jgi:hypothetical protein